MRRRMTRLRGGLEKILAEDPDYKNVAARPRRVRTYRSQRTAWPTCRKVTLFSRRFPPRNKLSLRNISGSSVFHLTCDLMYVRPYNMVFVAAVRLCPAVRFVHQGEVERCPWQERST